MEIPKKLEIDRAAKIIQDLFKQYAEVNNGESVLETIAMQKKSCKKEIVHCCE